MPQGAIKAGRCGMQEQKRVSWEWKVYFGLAVALLVFVVVIAVVQLTRVVVPPSVAIVVDTSGSTSYFCALPDYKYPKCLTAFDVERIIALELYWRLAKADLWAFNEASLDSAGYQQLTPEELMKVEPAGRTSFQVALEAGGHPPNGAVVLITDAEGSPPDAQQLLEYRSAGTKLIVVVVNWRADPSYEGYDLWRKWGFDALEFFAKETGGRVVLVDPLNIQKAIDEVLQALPKAARLS